jgi:hypothetical protein
MSYQKQTGRLITVKMIFKKFKPKECSHVNFVLTYSVSGDQVA